jgi:hypothetical protein
MDIKGAILIGLVYLWLCPACSISPRDRQAIGSPEDLRQALRASGLEVVQTPSAGTHFEVPNEILQVDSSLVYVYQFDDPDQLASRWEELQGRGGPVTDQDLPVGDEVLAWSVADMIVLSQAPPDHLARTLDDILGAPILTQFRPRDEPFPPAISTAIGDVAEEYGFDPGEITVLDYESLNWPDACLGYPQEQESCEPPPVPGWRILLRLDGREIEVHTDLLGDQVRLP